MQHENIPLRHCLFHTRSRLWRPEGERRTEVDNTSHSCSAGPSSTAVRIIETQAAQTVSGIIAVIPSGHLAHIAKENVLLIARNSVVNMLFRCGGASSVNVSQVLNFMLKLAGFLSGSRFSFRFNKSQMLIVKVTQRNDANKTWRYYLATDATTPSPFSCLHSL